MAPTTRRQQRQLSTAPANERASPVQSREYERMQAEINELKDKNETLKKERTSLKQAITRIKKQKESIKKTKKETKGALQMKCKVTEKAAMKSQKENEKYKILLEEKSQQLEEKDQQLEEQKQQIEQDEEDLKRLSDQNLEFTKHIAVSSRMDNQMSDETILEAMGYTYTAISDCFYGVLRRKDHVQSTTQHLEPTTYSGAIDVDLADWKEDLDTYVPHHRDNNRKDKLHLCIATVGWILTTVVKKEWVFGYPCTDQIEAATSCWNHLPQAQGREAQKKLSQWLALTKDILTDKDEDLMSMTIQTLLEEVLDKSQELLEGLTDIKVNKSIRHELSEALAPFLETMCMLPYQRWQYTFDMVRALDEGDWTPFDPTEMEGTVGEETGWVKASLFPQLCRIQWDGPEEKLRRTVVYKARVAVMQDLPTPVEEDAVMTEDEDVENSVIDLTGEGEDVRTPERGSPEIVVPDSVDGDEEDSMYGKGWPH